jgi:hypothetical protein
MAGIVVPPRVVMVMVPVLAVLGVMVAVPAAPASTRTAAAVAPVPVAAAAVPGVPVTAASMAPVPVAVAVVMATRRRAELAQLPLDRFQPVHDVVQVVVVHASLLDGSTG